MVIMTSRYQIVTNTATQTATIVSESPILAWYQARIGDSDTIVTGLPTLDTIVAHNCQIVNRLDTIVTHNCNDAVWVGPYERAYQRILFGVASLRRNQVDRGKARVCHFGPYREYRKNEAAPNKILRYAI